MGREIEDGRRKGIKMDGDKQEIDRQ